MSAVYDIDALVAHAFARPRDPRSDEYKAGMRAILAARIEKTPTACPYAMGTAAADAFFSGADEGRRIWSDLQARAAA